MLVVISPAKKLDMTTAAPVEEFSMPEALDEAAELVAQLRELDPFQLADLMKLSMQLADLNANRFSQWELPFSADNAKQALFAFQGDVYQSMDAGSFTEQDIHFTQYHLRILSGLYGVLRPLDLMQAYRLEMGTRLNNVRGQDLYAFWGSAISHMLNRALADEENNVLINLASNEYFKSVHVHELIAPVITPVFKEYAKGSYKVVGIHAKKARGMMTRYIIKKRLKDAEALKQFEEGGYQFDEGLSSDDEWVFCR
ncbi:MAG: hypothetical protein CO186_04815 [Zetaproteobacteria bacterium CG_4_9_14_3_um_filter_49_83]|nr:MAG: hypothetical protein AUJ56_00520 [Zetaproteobacteria bacterium CG1_02_49_23]PIQ31526.1 MAG: hypothetical protein COW62_09700 [Zetaproteobacteria bacterium CG17_big_fil_post_rev_8_21_14_2_50_50_13]PIV31113.1 MAG: hypothetical protein COS35_03215 [Zetaproteobacteria bacterium CG02_land_8_20_14_3_00_50_9]PIY54595.1 MAG: hypothetical protein COZ00_13665 [Zetaproteobacteria bacterium CG_4_10_14_0_8_um_filter_49_80]PJA35676.1 MAG: hypothetical protein CO186_04815 [Zetaproteobacteria bacterium